MMAIILQALIAGLGTLLGAALVLCCRELKARSFSFLLALASGIMGFVVIIDLLPSSLMLGGVKDCLAGFLAGLLVITAADILINYRSGEAGNGVPLLGMGYLIALGIALHDLPEGLAIAAGYSGGPAELGPVIALAIGLHNIPEGMATAAPLRAGGAAAKKILGLNAAVSFVTPLGTLLGLLILNVSSTLVSVLLAFAAGAMTYIVLDKLVPAARKGQKGVFFLGVAAGLAIMAWVKLFFE